MEEEVEIGDHVIFVDERGRERDALVTAIHHGMRGPDKAPGVNLVTVVTDDDRTDNYGRQTERHSSIVPEEGQPAGGNFWRHAE